MSKAKGYPHKQGFNIKGKKNQSKTRAWWQVGSSNNKSNRSQ